MIDLAGQVVLMRCLEDEYSDLTKGELAEMLGISAAQYSHVRAGRFRIGLAAYLNLEDAMNGVGLPFFPRSAMLGRDIPKAYQEEYKLAKARLKGAK